MEPAAYPTDLQSVFAKFDFVPSEELPRGHCSRVFASDSSVLKIPFQGEELQTGCLGARLLETVGGPKVSEVDETTGAVLMERLLPGTPMGESDLSDEIRKTVFVDFAKRMMILPTEKAIPLNVYFQNHSELFHSLSDSTQETRLLHGDLHPFNLLLHGNEWRVIDAKVLVGDPAFECAAYLRNCLPEPISEIHDLTEARIATFSRELNLDSWRIAAWALVDREDDGNADPKLTEVLREMVFG